MQRSGLRTVPLAAAAALVTLGVHLAGNPHYGYFRDELYFIVCGMHPAWGYVDQPPLVPLLSAASQMFGHSLFLLRVIPAIFAALSVYTTCLLTAELGGDAFAVILAAVVAALTPVLMSFGSKVTTDVVGLWLWPLAALYVLRIVKGADPRLWLAVGAIVGIGVECKYSILFFALAIVAGLALLPERRVLFNRWFVFGGLIAAAFAFPNFLWQAQHAYPMLTLLNDAHEDQNVSLSLPQYLATQVLITHPLLAPVWIVGLIGLFVWRRERFLGVAYVLLIAAMVALHGKHYYPGSVYPIPIAAGAVVIARWTQTRRFLRPMFLAYVLVAGLILVPLLMPVLSAPAMAAYDSFPQRFLGSEIKLAKTDRTRMGNLPPDWSDMLGWDTLAQTVARVYDSLPPAERAQAAILASNYGEASAIDFFGPQYGLPPVLSGHNQFWLWGTHGYSGNVIIDVHGDCRHSAHLFRVERVVAHFSNPWGRPMENGFPISLCEGIAMPLADYWPKFRAYI
jgi:hypothetical protein